MKFEGMTIAQAKKWSLPFGKYKGELIVDIFVADEEYLEWLHEKLDIDSNLKLAIELACWTKED